MSDEAPNRSERRAAVAAWSTMSAPGALVTCAVIAAAMLAANSGSRLIVVAPAARHAAALLLLLHIAMTAALALWPGRWMVARLFLCLLAADALLCGLATNEEWHGPAALLVLAVIVMSLEVGGWSAAVASTIAAGIGMFAAVWWGVGTPVLVPTPVSFPTIMSVETSFAGVPAVSAPMASFSTHLSVETWFAGMPAYATADELFVPTLALVVVALGLGLATTMWRVRRARAAVAASIVAAARVLP